MIKIDIDRDMVREMERLADRLGETTSQATARLATSAGRELAIVTLPRGKSTQKGVQANIEGDARRTVVTRNARAFNAMVKDPKPRRRTHRGWIAVDRVQFLLSEPDIWQWIEAHRGRYGRVKKLDPARKGIAPEAIFKRVLARRKKLAGLTKGAWVGAGISAGRLQRGAERLTIGKNFMAWAQKHSHLGSAKWGPGRRSIAMHNRSVAADHLMERGAMDEALDRSWKNTAKWYRKAIRGAKNRS